MDNPAGFIISMMEMNACRENDNPMPGDLSDLRLFERFLATGSLSAAAREACLLRIGAPFSFGRSPLLPPIATFRNQYPDLRVHLELDDNLVDLLQTGTDPAIRDGQPQDSSRIGRELAPNHRLLYAAPDYLDWHGRPQHPTTCASMPASCSASANRRTGSSRAAACG
jgi:DNA-binding transcriptional LysR family regulator